MAKRITAAAVAAALALSLSSCAIDNLIDPYKDKSETEQPTDAPQAVSTEKSEKLSYEKVDIDEVNDLVEQLLKDIRTKGNKSQIEEERSQILDVISMAYEAYSASYINYCLDWENEDTENEHDDCALTYNLAYEAASYAFHKGYDSKEYSDLFTDLITEDDLEFYTNSAMSLKRLEGYTKVDFELSDERSDEYYAIYYDDSLDEDEKSLRCAEIYLDILTNYDTETFYDNYSRDYTPEEVISVGREIQDKLQPLYTELARKIVDYDNYEDIWDVSTDADDIFEDIRKYARELSPEIAESAERIIDTEHYRISSGADRYDGSFTVPLPVSEDQMVYIYADGSYMDLTTAIHEFGHYHAGHFDKTPIYSTISNDDIAEIQSQGMELLFMQFYDDIYGDLSDPMKLTRIMDFLSTIETSFLVGEFEYTVLSHRDEYTPQDVIDCYNDIMGEYAADYPFYWIDHIFIYPGYYISYGVSALAAMELFSDCVNSPETAVEMYSRIAHLPANDPDIRFRTSLSECGFSDVLTIEYIDKLFDEIVNFINSL